MKRMRYILLFIVAFQSNAQISDFDHINFQKADSIALVYKNEGLKNLPELSHKLTSNLKTDAERFRAIYIWVCSNIANDYSLYLKNKRKRHRFINDSLRLEAWNEEFKKEIFQALANKKQTICTGYAYLIKKLSNLANLNCEIIHGYGRISTTNIDKLNTPNHSWNAIQLDGKWYLCDPTWASGIPNPTTLEFNFQYNDGFFLTHPKLFAINHYPEDEQWLLLEDDAPSFNDFLEAPVVYGKAYINLALHDAPKTMHQTIQKNEIVTFKYQLHDAVSTAQISFEIDNGSNNKKTQPTSTTFDNASLTVEYLFENTGFYDVHLFIGDDRISTYTFLVEN